MGFSLSLMHMGLVRFVKKDLTYLTSPLFTFFSTRLCIYCIHMYHHLYPVHLPNLWISNGQTFSLEPKATPWGDPRAKRWYAWRPTQYWCCRYWDRHHRSTLHSGRCLCLKRLARAENSSHAREAYDRRGHTITRVKCGQMDKLLCWRMLKVFLCLSTYFSKAHLWKAANRKSFT